MTEYEMKIQRALGVATYVKLLPISPAINYVLREYQRHLNLQNYVGKYAKLLDDPYALFYGTVCGSPLRSLKFEDGEILYIREADFKII